MLFTLDFLREGDLFVDVGANLGVYSVVVANHGCRVLAFEPNHSVAAILRENASLNRPELISVHECAVGDSTGLVAFGGPTDSQGTLYSAEADAETVPITTLDEAVAEERPALIKIDVEGYDGLVLKGGNGVIERHRPVVITEVFGGSPANRRWLEDRHYRVYKYSPGTRTLDELSSDFDSQGSFIAVHRGELERTKQRLESSKRPRLRPPQIEWRPSTRTALL
jgi:FkbM family methyltransferase